MGDGGLVPEAPHGVEAPLAGQVPGTPLPPHVPVSRPEKTAWDKIRSAAGPHVAGAARDTAGAALSLGGVLIPGTVKGIKEGAEAATKAAGDAVRRGLPDLSRTENPISAKEFAQLPDTGTIDPKRIRTMQVGVSNRFRDSRSLEETVEGLQSGRIKPEDKPPVRIEEVDGEIYTIDHRRLVAFREAGVPIKYQKISNDEMADEIITKWDTRDNGLTTRIRRGRGVKK